MNIEISTETKKKPDLMGCAGAAFILVVALCILILVVGGTTKVVMGWFA